MVRRRRLVALRQGAAQVLARQEPRQRMCRAPVARRYGSTRAAAVLSRPRPGGAAEVVRGPALPAALEFWVQFPFARHHSGIAAASSILAGWLAQRPHICVTGSATANTSKITAPGPQACWSTASPLVRTRVLDQDCKCVEAPPDVAPNAAGADNAQACAAAPSSLPPQNLLARQHDLSEESQRSFVKL